MGAYNPQALKFFKTDGTRTTANDVVARLQHTDKSEQIKNANLLLQDASLMGVSIDVALAMQIEAEQGLDGIGTLFKSMGIPVNFKGNDVASACFAAATSSFLTNDGLKVLLPTLINSMLVAVERAPVTESVEDLIYGTRTVKNNVLQKEIAWDKQTSDSFASWRIAEGANIPKRTLKASQTAINFYKTGHAIEMSYEVASTMTPDVLVPFAARIALERSQSEHAMAMETIINGTSADVNNINAAVKTVSLDTLDGQTNTALRYRAEGFMKWLIQRARLGLPVDTIVVGWDSIMELQNMFPVTDANNTAAVGIAGAMNGTAVGSPQMATMQVKVVNGVNFNLNVVITSALGEKQILGFRKPETIERLIKTNSQIAEMERVIQNQMVLYTNTIISGFDLTYGDTRSMLTWT